MAIRYERGAVEVADGVWAYLQPDGGWGWSNAGFVDGGEHGLLVDTLFDSRLTRLMLDDLARVTRSGGRVATVVNTHANGDHCFGNSVLAGAEIVASAECAREMLELPPARLAGLMRLAPSWARPASSCRACSPRSTSRASSWPRPPAPLAAGWT